MSKYQCDVEAALVYNQELQVAIETIGRLTWNDTVVFDGVEYEMLWSGVCNKKKNVSAACAMRRRKSDDLFRATRAIRH